MNLSRWIPGPEGAERLGVSIRTLERYAEDGRCESKLRPRDGRKPERVYNPQDIEKLEAELNPPFVASRSELTHSPAVIDSAIAPIFVGVLDRLAAAFERVMPATLPPAPPAPAWMTPAEGAKYLGLSEGLIRRLIRSGKLPRLREARGFVVAKVHLDNLDAMTELSGLATATTDLREVLKTRRAAGQ